ncbi:hypothetical protein DOY81_006410, partial [Sarcophaga bullata]
MHLTTTLKSLFLIVLLVGTLSVTTEAAKVIFYSKPSVLTSQLLITQNRLRPCPKPGHLRDHRNRCRRAIIFSR